MIEPFEPGQVRTKKVEVTNQEKLLWLNSIDVDNWPSSYSYNTITNQVFQTEKIISYGVSSYGLDIRCADEFKIFSNINSAIVNPKNLNSRTYVDFKGDVCIIPPNSFVLARSLETFDMPSDVTGIVYNKSTYARAGINCFTTVIEPSWKGELVLEFANTTSLPAMLFANEGCAQVIFLEGDEQCEVTYADRNGKYMNQRGVQLPIV